MLARHAILLTPSIAASLPLACRGAERTFLVPHACTRPKNSLSSFLATDPKKHLLSPIIATLPRRTEITSVFATHPRPPWEASPFLFALSAAERNTSLAIALPQSPILLLLILLRTLWHNGRLTTLFQSTDYTLFPSRRGVYPISLPPEAPSRTQIRSATRRRVHLSTSPGEGPRGRPSAPPADSVCAPAPGFRIRRGG